MNIITPTENKKFHADSISKSKHYEINQHIEDYENWQQIVEGQKIRRACISSKTHRKEKTDEFTRVQIFQGYTQFTDLTRTNESAKPPKRKNGDITAFSKKSRLRMIKKINRIHQKHEFLPLFQTLTYHENFQHHEESKRHLDNYLKRLRRLVERRSNGESELKYIWKLEHQKRGAIHYHLAIFLDKEYLDQEELEEFRRWTGDNWAEVTGGSEKQRTIGTQTDKIENWLYFCGYITKYMGKTCEHNERGIKQISSLIEVSEPVPISERVPFKFLYPSFFADKATVKKTGRWWGMSNNFDCSAMFDQVVRLDQKEKLRTIMLSMVDRVYTDKIEYFENRPYYKQFTPEVQNEKIIKACFDYSHQYRQIEQGYWSSIPISHQLAEEFLIFEVGGGYTYGLEPIPKDIQYEKNSLIEKAPNVDLKSLGLSVFYSNPEKHGSLFAPKHLN